MVLTKTPQLYKLFRDLGSSFVTALTEVDIGAS